MMSDKVMLRPVIDRDNAIAIYRDKSKIDFTLAIIQVDSNGVKSAVQLKNGLSSDGKTFVALFDDNDIDFEIKVENFSLTRNMGFDVTYGIKYEFVVRKGRRNVFKALQENGHHLRFLSPNLAMAQLVVDLVAKEGVARKRAEMVCSRIQFDMQVGKSEPIVESLGQVVRVFVKILDGQTRHFDIGLDNTVYDLKFMIQETEGTPADQQRLIHAGRQGEDKQTLYDLRVRNESTLHLCLSLRAGGDPIEKMTDKIQALNVSSESGKGFGRRGVVGFGHKTDEHFGSCAFDADDNYYIEPFFIEFRLKK